MRSLVVALLLAGAVACAPRQVEVRTAPVTATQLSLRVTNNLSQAVNVYVTVGGTDTFIRQVGAKSSELAPIQGYAPGATVTLKAVTIDGTRTYTRSNVILAGSSTFVVP
jgi:hypothetical protein